MVLVGGVFRRCLGHEGGGFTKGTNAIISFLDILRQLTETPHSYHERTQQEGASCEPERGPSFDPAGTLTLDLQLPEL